MTDVTTLKTELELRLQKLTRRAVKIGDDLRQPGNDDWAENATETANDEVLEELEDSTRDEIEQIKQALKQINGGTYGICSACNKAIAKKRLEILPSVTLCVDCA